MILVTCLVLFVLGLSQMVPPGGDGDSADVPSSTSSTLSAAEQAFADMEARGESGSDPELGDDDDDEENSTKSSDAGDVDTKGKGDASEAGDGEKEGDSKTDTTAKTDTAKADSDEDAAALDALKEDIKELPQKRQDEILAGVEKVVGRAKEREAEATRMIEDLGGVLGDPEAVQRTVQMAEWGALLGDPETAHEAYRDLGLRLQAWLKEEHKIDVDLFAAPKPAELAGEFKAEYEARMQRRFGNSDLRSSEGWEDHEIYDTEGEFKAAKAAYAAMTQDNLHEAQANARLAARGSKKVVEAKKPDPVEAKTDKAAKPDTASNALVVSAKAVSELIKEMAVKDNGWPVTEAMVREAASRLPDIFKTNPAEAVRMQHKDSWLAHDRKARAVNPNVPVAAPAGTSQAGLDIPEPGKRSGADVAKAYNWTDDMLGG